MNLLLAPFRNFAAWLRSPVDMSWGKLWLYMLFGDLFYYGVAHVFGPRADTVVTALVLGLIACGIVRYDRDTAR